MEQPPDKVLDEVVAWVAARKVPTRHQARELLTGIGLVLLDDSTELAQPLLDRFAALIAASKDAWREAITGELSMAVTEHVRSADPRWLGNPKYDLPYTVDARHRLEARLACAEALQVEVDEELLEAVARADAILAPYLQGGGPQGA